MMFQSSLRLRLILAFILTSLIVFSLAAIVSYHETNKKVDEFFDTYQMVLARQLASADWNAITDTSQKLTNRLLKNIHNAEEEDEAIGFAIFNKTGKLIFHDNENGKDFLYFPHVGTFVNQPVDGEKWRIVWLYSADNNFVIAVGQELEYRNDIVWDMTEEFLIPWGIGIFILLILMILIISLEFIPLNKVAKNLENRSPNDLSPLDLANLSSEIRPLVLSLNNLFAKIKLMLDKERSFIADSAHELRSPLTALKVQLEVLQMADNDKQLRQSTLLKLQEGIARSSRLVEQLLALSKAESSLQDTISEKIIWSTLTQQLIEEYSQEATRKNINISFHDDGTAPFVKGNSLLASLIMRNLLDNALKYSPQNSEIKISFENNTLSVVNTNVQLDDKVLSLIGRRFYRPAGQKQSGSGLGLSIVLRIAEIYGCHVSFRNADNSFEVRIIKN